MSKFSLGIRPLKEVLREVEKTSTKSELRISKTVGIGRTEVARAKNYLLNHYQGVEAVKSFEVDGIIFDCVPFEQQPGMRGAADTSVPVAPDLPSAGEPEPTLSVTQGLGASARDLHGNQMLAPAGTIPIRRITMERIALSGGLNCFHSKTPGLPEPLASKPSDGRMRFVAEDNFEHEYAIGRQAVNNFGMTGKFSTHFNELDFTTKKQASSISQLWVTAQPGTRAATLQTVEMVIWSTGAGGPVGKPTMNVYYTSKGYENGFKAYNSDDGAFIQTSSKWLLGGALQPASTVNGDQYILQMGTQLVSGKWWVYFGGETSEFAVGYYPASVYSSVITNGLALQASAIDVGGEVGLAATFPRQYQTMGSGQHASQGWKKSAYVRDLRYFPTSGGAQNMTLGNLTADASGFYTASRARYAAPWNETLWYGGPGGTRTS